MPSINFFTEDVKFILKSKILYKNWIKEIIRLENNSLNELNFIFCSDPYLLEINRTYLNHDYNTDIITFDNSTEAADLLGDIFISVDTVRTNAQVYNTNFNQELARVIIHGVLHLLGYSDKKDKDKKIMRAKEDWALERIDL